MNQRHRAGSGKPTVFFAPFEKGVSKFDILRRVLDALEFEKTVSADDLTAVKVHFGEEGNDTYLNPQFAAFVVDQVKKAGGKPFLTDTSTLYTGQRRNAVDHLNLALRHGFSWATVGAPVVLADGLKSNDWRSVPIQGKFFDRVKIAGSIADAQCLVVLSHFKGHVSGGFGGAVKNLAMGCAPAAGKKEQHALTLVVEGQTCIACGRCSRNCPASAITMDSGDGSGKKAFIHKEPCIGCTECMTHCPVDAISIDWTGEGTKADFGCRMAEYALGAVQGKVRPLFINVMMDITPLCDCVGWSDDPIAPNVGIAASTDPVALDWFCHQKVNEVAGAGHHEEGCIFCHLHPKTDPTSQLRHGAEIGLGSDQWETVVFGE